MITFHNGKLTERILKGQKKDEALERIDKLPRIVLSKDRVRDVENIAHGIFSPLEGFLNEKDYRSVLAGGRLANDHAWTIPILLDVSAKQAEELKEGTEIALFSEDRKPIALFYLDQKYGYKKEELSQKVFGVTQSSHPGVAKVEKMGEVLLAGKIDLISEASNSFARYTLWPRETRLLFQEKGWKTVVGFQTRNIPHLGHEYIQKTALAFTDGLFINPVIGRKKKGDFKDEVILASYRGLIEHYYLKERAVMAILPTEMRYAGPREAIHHALVRKNFGCTHFIVGRDHAGVGNFYSPYAAQEIFDDYPDLGIAPLFFKSFFYCKRCTAVANEKTCPHSVESHIQFSGTKIRETLVEGKQSLDGLLRPEVAEIIRKFKDPFVG
jgi:sulfate adenylyltransferase